MIRRDDEVEVAHDALLGPLLQGYGVGAYGVYGDHTRPRGPALREHGRQAARSERDRPGGHAS